MPTAKAIDPNLKNALKEALTESLRENRELLQEILAEVLEDFALGDAIDEGRKTGFATRAEVTRALRTER